eukprot:PhF_6_TR37214/c0_g1_i1/m.54874
MQKHANGIQLMSTAIHNLCSTQRQNERYPLPDIITAGVRATKNAELLSTEHLDILPNELLILVHRVLHMFWMKLEKFGANTPSSKTSLPPHESESALVVFSYLHHCTVFLTNLCRRHLNEVQKGTGSGIKDMLLTKEVIHAFLPNTTTKRWWTGTFGPAALEVPTENFIDALRDQFSDVVPDILALRLSNLLVRMSVETAEVVHVLDVGLLCAGNLNIMEQLESYLVVGGESARASPRDTVPCTQCTQREYHVASLEKEILVVRKEVDYLRAKGDHMLLEQIAVDRDILKKQNEELRIALNDMERHLAEVKSVVQVLSGETNVNQEARKARLRDQLNKMVSEDAYDDMLDLLVKRATKVPMETSMHTRRAQSMPQVVDIELPRETSRSPTTQHVYVGLYQRPQGCDVCPNSASIYTSPAKFFKRRSVTPTSSGTSRHWKPATSHPR